MFAALFPFFYDLMLSKCNVAPQWMETDLGEWYIFTGKRGFHLVAGYS
jgi:hypothetical protein